MEYGRQQFDDLRVLRAAVLNGVEPPNDSVARLEARGINVDEMVARYRQQFLPTSEAH